MQGGPLAPERNGGHRQSSNKQVFATNVDAWNLNSYVVEVDWSTSAPSGLRL